MRLLVPFPLRVCLAMDNLALSGLSSGTKWLIHQDGSCLVFTDSSTLRCTHLDALKQLSSGGEAHQASHVTGTTLARTKDEWDGVHWVRMYGCRLSMDQEQTNSMIQQAGIHDRDLPATYLPWMNPRMRCNQQCHRLAYRRAAESRDSEPSVRIAGNTMRCASRDQKGA